MKNSCRIPFMGELKKNSSTYYQFSNYANSYIDSHSITPVYYIALNLGIDKTTINNAIKFNYTGKEKINIVNVASANSALSELIMKYYEAKCGIVLCDDKGLSPKYFESYFYHLIFDYITNSTDKTVYLDTDIIKSDEYLINGNVKIDGKDYTLESDADRALLQIKNSPIKYIGRINCHSIHEYGGKLFSDIHINIPAAHNMLGDVLPIIDTSNEPELNRKKISDVICTGEVTTDIPYLTAAGHVDDMNMIYDWKGVLPGQADTEYGYLYYNNVDAICNDETDLIEQKRLLLKNNIKIDFEYLLNNYQEYSVTHTTDDREVQFDSVLILGKDSRGVIVPCGIYFASHFDDAKPPKLVQITTKTDVSQNSDDGSEYSLRLSTGAQVMQNATYVYTNNDNQSDTNTISELSQVAARLATLSNQMRDVMSSAGNGASLLTNLIGNAYTIRRNVPYLVDYTLGNKVYKVWYVNGMNTGVCADGTIISNQMESGESEEVVPEETFDQSHPYLLDIDNNDCDFIGDIDVTVEGVVYKLSNIYIPKINILKEKKYLLLQEPIKCIDTTPLTSDVENMIPSLICNAFTSPEEADPNTIYTIYYKYIDGNNNKAYHKIEMLLDIDDDDTYKFLPITQTAAFSASI